MGLFDAARDILGGMQEQQGDSKAALLNSVIGMLAGSAQNGGLQGMIGAFQQAGLGEVVGSWIGKGENLPISADQLMQVLGNGQIAELAEKAGISEDSAAGQLAGLLPGIIDKLTPHGEVPTEGLGDLGDIGGLLSRFLAK